MDWKSRRIRLVAVLVMVIVLIAVSMSPLASTQDSQYSLAYLPTLLSDPAPAQAQNSKLNPQNSFVAEGAPLSTNSSGSVFFPQAGHAIKDAFLNYWLMNGGADAYGYPISEEFIQDGVSVQYFSKSRFEYQPSNGTQWRVALTNAGSLLTANRNFPPANAASTPPDRTFYSQTNHTLGGTFGQFWKGNGDIARFGYPISEEMQENGTTVQYFERARFELGANGRVQLGNVGAELLQMFLSQGLDPSLAASQPKPAFNMSFSGEATVFHANWTRVISLNKGWGNLPQDYVGRGLYAAAPADLYLYGRWARVTRGKRSVFVQFIDVINWPDIPYVRSRGIVIDLGGETYKALGETNGANYKVSFDVLWPDQQP